MAVSRALSRPRFALQPRRDARLAPLLDRIWAEAVSSGLVVYDPGGPDVEIVAQGPYRYHYLPRRATRPGAAKSAVPPPEGLRLAHSPCPFDGEEFVAEREELRLERDGRVYHLVCNRYPVTPVHFLPVRSWKEPGAALPQHLHGPAEIEDLLHLLCVAGPPFHVYFNSNRGADNSQSGSSVNHWHGQLFPLPRPVESSPWEGPVEEVDGDGGLVVGGLRGWPARHLLVESDPADSALVASRLWREAQALNAFNCAYNLEATILRSGRLRAFLFPRHPAPEVELRGIGRLNPNFGGWELTGDIVIPTREILEWIRGNPEEAETLTTRRLRETTRAPGSVTRD